MLIRLGYEIAIESSRDLPVISLLEIHPERRTNLRKQTKFLTMPNVATRTYRDLFGNVCRRLAAPAGTFTILYDALVGNSGEPDPVRAKPPHTLRDRTVTAQMLG